MPAKRTVHIIVLVLITSYLATVKSTTRTSKTQCTNLRPTYANLRYKYDKYLPSVCN